MERKGKPPGELDLVGAIIVELDPRGHVVTYNRTASTFFGAHDGELQGVDFFECLVSAQARREARAAFRRALGGKLMERELVEVPVLDARHEARPLLWKIEERRDPDNNALLGLVYSAMDLPDAPDRALARSLKELRDIRHALDASTIVAITDVDGTITSVNEKFCEISKYSRDELIGQNHRILNSGHHPREFFKQMWATIGRGKIWQGDIKNRAKDGSFYWVSTTIVPFLDDHGKPIQYVALRHEITARKLAEDALLDANRRLGLEQMKLIQAEKLSSIGLLAAGIAHEVNNPLSGVVGCVKAIRDQKMTETRREEYLATAMEGLERIQNTMRGLLDFARQRPTTPEQIEVSELVSSGLRLIAPALKKKDLRVETSIDPIDLSIYADRGQILQALVNVMLNAVYASPEKRPIHISATPDGSSKVSLEVRDRGTGIPPELLTKVCDPFFTTKPEGEGTGLGLAVTTGLMHANHGELVIESEVGTGTVVKLVLPKVKT